MSFLEHSKVQHESPVDVIEVSLLLQCLGYSMTTMQTKDASTNISQEAVGARNIVIHCPISGYTSVLDSRKASCSCPDPENDNSGLWSVTGMAHGIVTPQESGHSLIPIVPKEIRDRVAQDLHEMIRWIKDATKHCHRKSASTSNLELMSSPEKNCHYHLKVDSPMSPVRYRSLDTLTRTDGDMPTAGALTNVPTVRVQRGIIRQETYSLKGPYSPVSVASNKTSSPIKSSATLVELERNLLAEVENITSQMQRKLSAAITYQLMAAKVVVDESIAPLSLDMSKISVQQPEPVKHQFTSSPNLCALARDDTKSGLIKRSESSSTSKLESKMSRLRRLSPNFFKRNNNASQPKTSVPANSGQERKKLNIFCKRSSSLSVSPIGDANASPPIFTNANKKKFGHVKSTIPRATYSPILQRKKENN